MNGTPLISVVVTCWNSQNTIQACLESILSQSLKDFELIIVDNASSDNTHHIIKQYKEQDSRIKLIIHSDNKGAAGGRNSGLIQARGRYLCYLDGDDVWYPDKLKVQVNEMQSKGIAFSFTSYEFLDSELGKLNKIAHVPSVLDYKQALGNTCIFTSTVMFDLKQLTKDQLMMKSIGSEDTALWWSILRRGYKAYGINQVLVGYRRAAKTLSSNKLKSSSRTWNLYRNEERLSIIESAYYFIQYAFRAMMRRF